MTGEAMSATVSPLHRIRQAEAEAARIISSARHEAEVAFAALAAESDALVRKAREVGLQEGEHLASERIAAAEREAAALVAEARLCEEERRRRCLPLVDAAAAYVVDFVLGAEDGTHR